VDGLGQIAVAQFRRMTVQVATPTRTVMSADQRTGEGRPRGHRPVGAAALAARRQPQSETIRGPGARIRVGRRETDRN